MRKEVLIMLGSLFSFLCFSETLEVPVAVLYSNSSAPDYYCVIEKTLERVSDPTIKFKTQLFDYENDLFKSIGLATKIGQLGYKVAIGPRTSQEAIATAGPFFQKKVVQILPGATDRGAKKKNPLTVYMSQDHVYLTKQTAKLFSKYFRPSKVLVLKNESLPYSINLAEEYLKFSRNEKNIEKRTFSYFKGGLDKVRFVSVVNEFRPDVIYAPIYGADIALIYNAIGRTTHKLKLFSHAGIFESKKILKKGIFENIELYFNGIWNGMAQGPHKKLYKEITSKGCPQFKNSIRSALAFDSAMLLNLSVRKSGKWPVEKLHDVIDKLDYHGVIGKRAVDGGGALISMPVLKMVQSKFENYVVIK